MAASHIPSRTSLLGLPREIRDQIIAYSALPDFVYTSSDKPNTANLHRGKVQANTFIDTRIYLPCRLSPNLLGVCRQLRAECLQYQNYALASASSVLKPGHELETVPHSNILAERLGQEMEEEAERLVDRNQLRITLEVQRALRGPQGYAVPVRDELSPRFLALLPLMERARKIKLVVWAGFDWWDGSRPRPFVMVNGRRRIDEYAPAGPDAVSVAVGKVLEQLPAVEELDVDILAHVGDISRWDLPELAWANVQYWLDGPITPTSGRTLQRVRRKLCGVWDSKLLEPIYEQQETRIQGNTWHIKRHGDMCTPTMIALAAEPGELDDNRIKVNDEFDQTY